MCALQAPWHMWMCLGPSSALFTMSVWLGQTPTPEHRSDSFRIRHISKMSITTWASPLCQGSCDSISQSKDNKLFVKGKKKSTQNVFVHHPLYAVCQNPEISHGSRITALIKHPQNRRSENCAEQLRNTQPKFYSLWRQSGRAQEAWGVESYGLPVPIMWSHQDENYD